MKSRELEGVFRIGPIRYVNSAARSQRHALSSKFYHAIQFQLDRYWTHMLLIFKFFQSNGKYMLLVYLNQLQLCISSTGNWREASSID